MSATVFFASSSELATLSNAFQVGGAATDPTAVSLAVTTPAGVATTYTYAALEVTRTGTGAYSKDVTCSEAGTWQYVWTGTGAVSDVVAGTWTVYSTQLQQRYTSLEALKDYLGISDTGRDTLLTQAILGASRGIDAHCGRRFYLDAVASARTYRPVGRVVRGADGEALLVDDIASTTGLVVETGVAGGSTWTAVTDYEVEPENALVRGVAITALRRVGGSWAGSASARLRVTARWGWPATPDVVGHAALIQAARLYRRKDSPEGVTGSAEWGVIRLSRIDPDVQALVKDLVLPGFG